LKKRFSKRGIKVYKAQAGHKPARWSVRG